jgi:dolichol-phosphate mannosyltransferase
MNVQRAQTESPIVSVVVPMYNEEGNIALLLDSLRDELGMLEVPYEIILVDDGSQDQTWAKIEKASAQDPRIKGISFSRNFGHQNAIFAGLHYCRGSAIVTMDGDLQHPPATIPELFHAWKDGFKVVETRRIESRDITAFKRLTSSWFYRAFSFLSGLPMATGTSDFRLMDHQVAEAMTEMKDADLFLRGIAHWVGFRKTTIPYQAAPRHSGETKYSLFKMIRFAAASVFSFSTVPLRLGIWLGIITSGLAFLELIYILIKYASGDSVAGWASTLTVISFMFGILFILIGVIGAYLGNLCDTLKNRPRFLVDKTSGFQIADE